jgi:hypothetical protein
VSCISVAVIHLTADALRTNYHNDTYLQLPCETIVRLVDEGVHSGLRERDLGPVRIKNTASVTEVHAVHHTANKSGGTRVGRQRTQLTYPGAPISEWVSMRRFCTTAVL